MPEKLEPIRLIKDHFGGRLDHLIPPLGVSMDGRTGSHGISPFLGKPSTPATFRVTFRA